MLPCYNLVRGKTTDWGMELPNGSWSGSIGILHRGEASMSATVYSVSYKRSQAIDFGESIYIDEQTMAYLRPGLSPDIIGFLKPFTLKLWIGILMAISCVYCAMVAIQYGLNKFVVMSDLPEREKKKVYDSIGFAHWQWSFSGLIDQSMTWEPVGIPVRVVGGIWILTSLVLSMYYRSNLRAILITPKVLLPFNDFWQLSDTNIKAWTPLGSRFNEALDLAEEGSKMASIRENVHLTRNATEGKQEFFNGKWGIISVRKNLIYLLHHDFSRRGNCNFYIIGDGLLRTTQLSFGYPKGSSLRPRVDHIIRQLREAGIIDYLFNSRVRNASECLKPIAHGIANKHRSLAFGDFYGIFAIYAGGMILSLLSFFWEYFLIPSCKSLPKRITIKAKA